MPATGVNGVSESDVLYTQVQRRLVESGEWDKIHKSMIFKLNESGWTDDLRHHSKEKARVMDPLSFRDLLEDLSQHGKASLPLAVRTEVTTLIQQCLETQFET